MKSFQIISEPLQLGKIIRTVRKQQKLTQQDLADICGISLKPLKNIESGKGNISVAILLTLLNELGVQLVANEYTNEGSTGE